MLRMVRYAIYRVIFLLAPLKNHKFQKKLVYPDWPPLKSIPPVGDGFPNTSLVLVEHGYIPHK